VFTFRDIRGRHPAHLTRSATPPAASRSNQDGPNSEALIEAAGL